MPTTETVQRPYMTTYEFEAAAKNAVIQVMRERYKLELRIEELQLVWFAHTLGYKKCTLYAPKLGRYYPEVTYNRASDELYVDVYLKLSNTKLDRDQMDCKAHGMCEEE